MERVLTLGLVNAASATVLAMVVAGLGRFLVRRPAALHCLWLLVLLKLVTPPLLEVPILGRIPASAIGQPVLVRLERSAEVAVPDDSAMMPDEWNEVPVAAGLEAVVDGMAAEPFWPRWRTTVIPWLASIWLAGSAATLGLAAVRVHRFRRLLRQAYPAPDEVQEQVSALAGRLGLKRPPRTQWIDAALMPMLWAVACRPRLIIPRDLWKSLGQRQQALLLAHELAHLRRGDHLVRLFELVGDRPLLVASRRLVGASRAPRRRGTMLRRLGRLGIPRRGPNLCGNTPGYGRFSESDPDHRAAPGERLRPGSPSAKETDDDHAGNNVEGPGLGQRPGDTGPIRRALAAHTELGAEGRRNRSRPQPSSTRSGTTRGRKPLTSPSRRKSMSSSPRTARSSRSRPIRSTGLLS